MGKEKSSSREGPLIHSEDLMPGPGSQTHPWPLGKIGRVEPPKLEPHTDVTATQTHGGHGPTKAEYIWISVHQRS